MAERYADLAAMSVFVGSEVEFVGLVVDCE